MTGVHVAGHAGEVTSCAQNRLPAADEVKKKKTLLCVVLFTDTSLRQRHRRIVLHTISLTHTRLRAGTSGPQPPPPPLRSHLPCRPLVRDNACLSSDIRAVMVRILVDRKSRSQVHLLGAGHDHNSGSGSGNDTERTRMVTSGGEGEGGGTRSMSAKESDPSACMFWCAVALGGLARGAPIESVSFIFHFFFVYDVAGIYCPCTSVMGKRRY